MSFLGTYADLRGKRVGAFRVEELAGRNKSGSPMWRVSCDVCCYPQTLPHSKLAPLVQGRHSQKTLLCANAACPASRHERHEETIKDVRRQEKQQQIQVAEAQRELEAKAEKDRLKADRQERIRREFAAYLNHQWRVGAKDEQICNSRRWFSLSDESRKAVLDAMKKNPAATLLF
jgi:hypothetical protein